MLEPARPPSTPTAAAAPIASAGTQAASRQPPSNRRSARHCATRPATSSGGIPMTNRSMMAQVSLGEFLASGHTTPAELKRLIEKLVPGTEGERAA